MEAETMSPDFHILVMMGVGEGGFLGAFFCEVVEVAVEITRFGAFGFQLDGQVVNAIL